MIDRVTELLGRVIDRPDPSGWYADSAGVARVQVPVDTFDQLVTLAYAEIIRYGVDSPQIVRRLHAAFDHLDERCAGSPRAGVPTMRALLEAAVDERSPHAFEAISAVADPRGLG